MFRAPPRANRSLHMVTAFLEHLNSCFIRPRSLISRFVICRGNMSYTRPSATMSANHFYCPRKHRNLRLSCRPAMHDDGRPYPAFPWRWLGPIQRFMTYKYILALIDSSGDMGKQPRSLIYSHFC
jgi:hypothetical protein